MSKTYFTRKRGAQYQFSPDEKRRLESLSDAEIEANALSDPDNPPLTEEQLRRMVLAREVRLTREKLGLSQPEFAARFHIGLARLRDFEQARSLAFSPTRCLMPNPAANLGPQAPNTKRVPV
jgi:DNA-binding transcriptional regulator YiaG